ncbi:MAG: T9SS type A sorting domain-containing protein [Fidelibacterota bacterium]
MKKLLISLTLLASFMFAADVTLYVSGQVVDNVNGGTLDIYMVNTADVYGFQFNMDHSGLTGGDDISGVEYGAASGGTAAASGFAVSTNAGGLLLGFSFTGGFIPAGEGVLTTVEWNADTFALEGPVTLTVTNISGANGLPLTYEIGASFLSTDTPTIVEEYSLSNNYPNPFNPTTTIGYAVKEAGDVSIIVYDMLGREVNVLVNDYLQPNNYSVVWNGMNSNNQQVASGVYYYKMITNGFVDTKKMLFVK